MNLLQQSNRLPHLSTNTYLQGEFDYARHPLAPFRCRIIVHKKPEQRDSWGLNGIDGWYLGPAMDHYQCYNCYIPSTRAKHISDTVEFQEYKIP